MACELWTRAGILETAGQTRAPLPTDVALKCVLKSLGDGDGRKEALEICQAWSHQATASVGGSDEDLLSESQFLPAPNMDW